MVLHFLRSPGWYRLWTRTRGPGGIWFKPQIYQKRWRREIWDTIFLGKRGCSVVLANKQWEMTSPTHVHFCLISLELCPKNMYVYNLYIYRLAGNMLAHFKKIPKADPLKHTFKVPQRIPKNERISKTTNMWGVEGLGYVPSIGSKEVVTATPWWVPSQFRAFGVGGESSPLKIGHPKRKVIFQPSIFRCENVSFREAKGQDIMGI